MNYPTVPDLSIAVGDRVRSYDFHGRTDCYFVGTVTALHHEGFYHIRTEYRVFDGGPREPIVRDVAPPQNGQRCIWGPTCGVVRDPAPEPGEDPLAEALRDLSAVLERLNVLSEGTPLHESEELNALHDVAASLAEAAYPQGVPA